MGKGKLGYKKWVAVCLCSVVLLLSVDSADARTTNLNAFHGKGVENWYAAMATVLGAGGVGNQAEVEAHADLPGSTRQSLPAATNGGWRDIAIAVVAAGILVSISAVGFAVWRIKD
jgi:hypothetical protein